MLGTVSWHVYAFLFIMKRSIPYRLTYYIADCVKCSNQIYDLDIFLLLMQWQKCFAFMPHLQILTSMYVHSYTEWHRRTCFVVQVVNVTGLKQYIIFVFVYFKRQFKVCFRMFDAVLLLGSDIISDGTIM